MQLSRQKRRHQPLIQVTAVLVGSPLADGEATTCSAETSKRGLSEERVWLLEGMASTGAKAVAPCDCQY